MRKLKLIVPAIVVAGLASVLAWQYASNKNLRRDNDALRQALAELKPSQDVRDPDSSGETLTQEQRDELLKLRGEVTQLREQTNQIGDLADANKKLLVSLREAKAPQQASGSDKKKKGPEDALPQDIHPKDSWAFRGYATPEATVESVCWAMINGDKATMLKAFSPEMLPEMQEQMDKANFSDDIKKINQAEFRILDRQQLSDDEMVLTIYTSRQDANGDTTGNSEKTVFQKIGGEWKVTKKPPPDN